MPLVTGALIEVVDVGPGHTESRRFNYASDRLSYVAGGLVFNWPAGLFNGPPRVNVTIETQNAGYSPLGILSMVVTSNTALATTVRVNKGSVGGGMAEALTDDFFVSVEAKEIVTLRKHQEVEAVLDADHLHVAWPGRDAFD